ncbi:hypothetical protein HEP89_29540 (plasmid) [Labrenzia sp. 5N]|uniref:hypothetical protein n=1 Tax=Labrenzia sp. 5N TaxID=2723402 RepID=UPI0014474B71|nr:hypothetical protein [Labrenzia sp. 5N]NKX68283.1 hypothetical protein [Labrenzia sp. 5N]
MQTYNPQTVQSDTIINLPWLRPHDQQMEQFGYEGVHANVRVPAGANVYVDVANQKARIQEPGGRVYSWYRNGKMRYNPNEKSWDMKWLELGSGSDAQASFRPMYDGCDDEIVQASGYEFEADGLEGKQDTYFPQFVELLRDPFFNPAGFRLESGLYKSDMTGICFYLNFGEDGSKPRLEPIEETLPATLDFPYRAIISLNEDLSPSSSEDAIPSGGYHSRVTSFHIATGAVRTIEIRDKNHHSYKISGDDMVQYMHEGKIELISVLEENWRNF